MRRRTNSAGFSLLEVVVAMTIFAIAMSITLLLLKWSVEEAGMDIAQTYSENQVQDAVDQIVADLKETSPFLCTFQNFNESGRQQTAMCFPTARERVSNHFKVDIAGAVQSRPVWQGVVVYCYLSNPNRTDGSLFKYVDYSSRPYTGPLYVSSVTATHITVTQPDGTVTAVFDRRNNPPTGGNQERRVVAGYYRQVSVQMGPVVCWNCGGSPSGTPFTPQPPTFACPNCAEAGAGPIQLTISSEVQYRTSQLHGSSAVLTLTNEALSRNQN